jgi:DNA-binding GntR family transcriptional regulator
MAKQVRDQPSETRYELVERALRANIASGRLSPGLVLLEGPIAALLQTSRAPVQKALQILEADGLIHRFGGRGYLVGRAAASPQPLRIDVRRLGLAIPEDVDEALQSRGSRERISAAVEESVASCVIFGEYRIIETEIAHHFNVSRTVVRDVLGRLQERSLVRKNQSSHWIAGPLTAQSIKEHYDLRRILEPAAILAAAPRMDREHLSAILHRAAAAETIDTDGTVTWEDVEAAFIEHCVLTAPNERLVATIRHNRLPLAAVNRLLAQLGLPIDRAAIAEIRLVLELLLRDAVRSAAEFWRDHLDMETQRSIARLKIVAVIPEPKSLAPYLTPV